MSGNKGGELLHLASAACGKPDDSGLTTRTAGGVCVCQREGEGQN